jgi:hypothetical protein
MNLERVQPVDDLRGVAFRDDAAAGRENAQRFGNQLSVRSLDVGLCNCRVLHSRRIDRAEDIQRRETEIEESRSAGILLENKRATVSNDTARTFHSDCCCSLTSDSYPCGMLLTCMLKNCTCRAYSNCSSFGTAGFSAAATAPDPRRAFQRSETAGVGSSTSESSSPVQGGTAVNAAGRGGAGEQEQAA